MRILNSLEFVLYMGISFGSHDWKAVRHKKGVLDEPTYDAMISCGTLKSELRILYGRVNALCLSKRKRQLEANAGLPWWDGYADRLPAK